MKLTGTGKRQQYGIAAEHYSAGSVIEEIKIAA